MADDTKNIWPKTPGQEPAALYTVETDAQMDDFAGMQAFVAGSIPFQEEKITRARHMLEGVESHLDEAIEGGPFFGEDEEPGVHIGPLDGETPEQHADRVYQELRDQHTRSGGPSQWMKDAVAFYHRTVVSDPTPFVLTKTGRIQDLTDEDLEGFDFATDDEMAELLDGAPSLEEMLAAEPGALPIQIDADFLAWDRVPGPAMDDDDDEWEIEFETFGSDPGDMATIARAYLNMTTEEREDFDRDLPDARSELRAFIDSLDDKEAPDVQS